MKKDILIYHSIDTTPGQSGSGIVWKSQNIDKNVDPIIGIHTGTDSHENFGTRITREHYNWMMQIVDQYKNKFFNEKEQDRKRSKIVVCLGEMGVGKSTLCNRLTGDKSILGSRGKFRVNTSVFCEIASEVFGQLN